MGQLIYEQVLFSMKEELFVPTHLNEAMYIISAESDKQKAVAKLIIH